MSRWDEIDALLGGLRSADFPVDGFVLDLNWFGGVVPGEPSQSEMGRLDWDENQEARGRSRVRWGSAASWSSWWWTASRQRR